MENKKYKVSIIRTAYSVREIEVEGVDEKDAQEKALDCAGDHQFSEHSSSYEVESVYPI